MLKINEVKNEANEVIDFVVESTIPNQWIPNVGSEKKSISLGLPDEEMIKLALNQEMFKNTRGNLIHTHFTMYAPLLSMVIHRKDFNATPYFKALEEYVNGKKDSTKDTLEKAQNAIFTDFTAQLNVSLTMLSAILPSLNITKQASEYLTIDEGFLNNPENYEASQIFEKKSLFDFSEHQTNFDKYQKEGTNAFYGMLATSVQQIETTYNGFKAKYIKDIRDAAGMYQYWLNLIKNHKAELLARILSVTVEQQSSGKGHRQSLTDHTTFIAVMANSLDKVHKYNAVFKAATGDNGQLIVHVNNGTTMIFNRVDKKPEHLAANEYSTLGSLWLRLSEYVLNQGKTTTSLRLVPQSTLTSQTQLDDIAQYHKEFDKAKKAQAVFVGNNNDVGDTITSAK